MVGYGGYFFNPRNFWLLFIVVIQHAVVKFWFYLAKHVQLFTYSGFFSIVDVPVNLPWSVTEKNILFCFFIVVPICIFNLNCQPIVVVMKMSAVLVHVLFQFIG